MKSIVKLALILASVSALAACTTAGATDGSSMSGDSTYSKSQNK